MSNKFGSNLIGGSAFWHSYAESIVSTITDGHARLAHLTEIEKRYEYLVRYQQYIQQCRGCNFHFCASGEENQTCNVCSEIFCCELPLPKCILRQCTKCQLMCCLSDRTFGAGGNLVCIDCIDYHGPIDRGSEDSSMSLYSDSEQLSPSESEEEVSSEEE